MRKEQLPAAIAAKGFQAEQGFITGLAPELAGTFKAALILAAS
jgi:hypothetical protein